MKRVTNLSLEQHVLHDGTILGASGSEGSVKDVESIDERDLKRLAGSISVKDVRDDQPRTAPADGIVKTPIEGQLNATTELKSEASKRGEKR